MMNHILAQPSAETVAQRTVDSALNEVNLGRRISRVSCHEGRIHIIKNPKLKISL
eukprot:SAG11_NODE_661_length_7885_cov_8.956974_15_plen_55_part_00